ncbi:MAG: hypothetical protein MJZ25_15515 [Fibrobacter sp.]|nr:hypothetical protein [Fibrobacter sp.]
MDIQKKKVPKDKAWSVATKTAAMAALGLTAGLGLGACSKEEPEPIIFGDVGTDLTVSVTVRDDSADTMKVDSTKNDSTIISSDSICVRDSSSDVAQKLSQMKGRKAPLMGKAAAISDDEVNVIPKRRRAATNKSKPVPLGGVPRAPEPNEK